MKYAAFELPTPLYDAIAIMFRVRGYDHLFGAEGAIYLDNVAFTRSAAPDVDLSPSYSPSYWLIQNGKTGIGLRYIGIINGGWTWVDHVADALHFSRKQDADLYRGDTPGWISVEHR